MYRNYFILAGLLAGCFFLMHAGCQKPAQVTADRTTLPEEETTKVAEKPGAPLEKPKPVLEKLKPEATVEISKVAVVAEEAETVPAVTQPAPKITFEKEVCDFGEVGPGTTKSCELKLTNAGGGPLKITDVRRCCGVVAKTDKAEYAPGESGMLTIQPHFGSGRGTWSRKVYVTSNDSARPQVAVVIKANIVPKIDWEPRRLKFSPKDANAPCPQITVKSYDNQPFSITGFKSTGDCITADYDASVQATEFVLQPKVDYGKLQKDLKGHISISLTHPERDNVIVTFDVLAKFTVSPPTLVVFNAKPDSPLVRKVWIINNLGEDFEIESVSSENNTVKVLAQKKVRNGYQLDVEIAPPVAQEGQKLFTDVLSVNVKDDEKLVVSCRGFYFRKNSGAPTPVRRGSGPSSREP